MNRLQILWYVYEAVRRVPCSYRRQALLARKAYGFVTAFLRENPEADRAGLLAAFGEPADFAAALLEYIEPDERAAEFVRKSWARRAIVLALGTAALVCGGLCILSAARRER